MAYVIGIHSIYKPLLNRAHPRSTAAETKNQHLVLLLIASLMMHRHLNKHLGFKKGRPGPIGSSTKHAIIMIDLDISTVGLSKSNYR